ncbi:accessory Sec-dependent serine-rich glycoprotein adhesin [Streptococcus sanguinis]
MFFKRQKGKYHEVERVTRFKLIKSGKHWLRAATSQFGLFRSMKGGGLSSIELKVTEEQVTDKKSGIDFLRGIVATGAVLGGAVVTSTTVHAEEGQALEKVIDTTDVLATRGETVLGEESSAAEAATATASSHTESESVSDTSSASASASVSASISASISASESMSQFSSASISASTSQSVSDSLSVSESLSVSSSASASVSASTSQPTSSSQSVSASQTSASSASETGNSTSSQQSTESSSQTGRRRTRRATDTTPPTITLPQEVIAYRGEEFEFFVETTDDSGRVNRVIVRNIEGADNSTYLDPNWIRYSTDNLSVPGNATPANPLRTRVYGIVPINHGVGPGDRYTKYVRAEDAAGNITALVDKQSERFVLVIRPQTEKYTPQVPTLTYVQNANSLTQTDKDAVIAAVKSANPNLPATSTYSVSENGTVTITYPDGSTDTIAAA